MIYQIAYLFFENRSHNKLEYNASTAHEERERERERDQGSHGGKTELVFDGQSSTSHGFWGWLGFIFSFYLEQC